MLNNPHLHIYYVSQQLYDIFDWIFNCSNADCWPTGSM